MVMLKAPIGRVGDKRSPAAALRFFLFQETSLGYYADVAQVSRGGRRGSAALAGQACSCAGSAALRAAGMLAGSPPSLSLACLLSYNQHPHLPSAPRNLHKYARVVAPCAEYTLVVAPCVLQLLPLHTHMYSLYMVRIYLV